MNEVRKHTLRKFALATVVAGAPFFYGSKVVASPLLNPADFLPGQSWFFSVSGQSVQKKPVLEISSVNDVQIPLTSGNATIFSGSNTDIETESESDGLIATVGFKPREGLQYQFKFGQLRHYQLEFSSGSHTNKLDALNDGILWGFGLGGRIAPASIVSVGISWQLEYSQSRIDLDRFQSPGVVAASNIKFQEDEYQGSINFSHRWKNFEPYGGLKILRTVAKITDRATSEKVKGHTDDISPFLGTQWAMAENEMVTVEGSILGEESLSASVKIQF